MPIGTREGPVIPENQNGTRPRSQVKGETLFSAYSQFDAVHRQTEVIAPLDNEASGGYDSVGKEMF